MARVRVVMVIVASLTFVFQGTAPASSRTRPSDRACLIAWNTSANHGSRLRLLAERPISGLRLLPGTIGTDTWTKGAPPTQTSTPACLLTVAEHGEIRIVSGIWKKAGVSRWSFGRPIPADKPLLANVRLLADGRVAKIYRR